MRKGIREEQGMGDMCVCLCVLHVFVGTPSYSRNYFLQERIFQGEDVV